MNLCTEKLQNLGRQKCWSIELFSKDVWSVGHASFTALFLSLVRIVVFEAYGHWNNIIQQRLYCEM